MKEPEKQEKPRKMSLSTKVFWKKIILGILWLLAAVTGLFRNVRLLDFVHLLSLLSALVLNIAIFRFPADNFDEMAHANQQQAKAKALDILTYCLIGIALTVFMLSSYFPAQMSQLMIGTDHLDLMVGFIFLILGLNSLITGLIFRKLEAN